MAPTKHGQFRRLPGGKRATSPETRAYVAMKTRCLNPNQARFKDYGARGISICSRWIDGEGGLTGLECFLADMGPKPSPDHTLDREDNDGDYSPANCRWADRSTQARNSRNARLVQVNGQSMNFVEAVERFGAVSLNTAAMRVHRGWDPVEAILTPKGAPGKPNPHREATP